MKLYTQARPAHRVAVVVALILILFGIGVRAQPKPTAETITVYQDPG